MNLNASAIKETLAFIIKNNVKLGEEGKKSISSEVRGLPGVGKTSVVEQVAKELEMPYIEVPLAELLVEDLTGFNVVLHKLCKDEGRECCWVNEKAIEGMVRGGWEVSGEIKMDYAPPMWIQPYLDGGPVILCLDDYSRSSPMMMQAIMRLAEKGEAVAWKLPKGSSVVLTSNPDDGESFVTTQDDAQCERKVTFDMSFDKNIWITDFAIPYGIDDRCIAFINQYGNEVIGGDVLIMKDDKTGTRYRKASIRTWTKYFELLRGLGDWKNTSETSMIRRLAGDSIPLEHVSTFINFIKDTLEKLPSPDFFFNKKNKVSDTISALESVVRVGAKGVRTDLVAIFTKRLINYVVGQEANLSDSDLQKFGDLLYEGTYVSNLLSEDLTLIAMKRITGLVASQPRLREHVMSKKLTEKFLETI